MDNTPSAQQQYSSNQLGTSGSSYPSPSAIAPHQLQQGSSTQHTLPPLQHNNNSMQSIYGSHPHTPRTPGTPSTPQPQNNMSNYPPPNAGPARGSYGMMPNQYQNPPQGYPTTTSMMPQASVAASHPQPIAPAPAAARPPVLRPMPAGGIMPTSGMSSPYGGSPMMSHQPSLLQDTEQPTHVVGSQGRRGILPSAPGRPAAPTGSGASKNTVIPQKDADGKFPCPHCTKTYLHAKHLKRHLLRHTGDRPYMCVLCRDTFSRSDILKRHFQKCSIRRGNPTGASHLSHPQAHVKKQQQNAQKANEGDLSHMNGMASMSGDGVVHPFGMVQIQDGMGNMANDQNQLSRSSSMSRMDDAANRDRRNMPGGYNGEVPNSMASNINPQLANFNMPPNQNGMPMYGASGSNQQSGLDWSQMFQQPGAQPTHTYNTTFPSPNIGQNQTAIKTEPNLNSERSNGTPGAPSNDGTDRPPFISNWEPQISMQDGCQQLTTQIVNFFYPPGNYISPENNAIHLFFHPENIRFFLESFIHFHIHFSFLHIPTFRIMEAYPGLTAAMCCIGACYSDRVDQGLVREVTTFLNIALERDCNLVESQPLFKIENGKDKVGLEKLQALVLMSSLLIWNGTPIQRETARRVFPVVASIARCSDLLRIQNDSSLYSFLHQPNLDLQKISSQPFDWVAWVEQEKRIRLMHMVYLLDVARGLYFNLDPQFDAFEICIPLPADDAAWEAQSGDECADTLNLFGSDAVKKANPDGSQRSKQPELHLVLRAMLDDSIQIQPGSTNLWGKFILIHAILAQVRRVHMEGDLTELSGSTTPLRQNDWVVMGGSDAGNGRHETNNSGRNTPIPGTLPMSPEMYHNFSAALDKWKSYWDMDMAIQFPPSVSNPRRHGFSRDGPHFFWLAKLFLRTPRLTVVQLGPDQRLTQVIQLLKAATAWVETDGASRGEEFGSVGEMNPDYAVSNLTLDMTQFFKPLPAIVESSTAPCVKTRI
ncbi:fungal-specific transcription factor domain-containing protein [Ustulina deusta]|nr:fungal-specific transcription factor domain-containing protein [Ustulina deusta]KAI3337704.1 fungal-specific transcription factor domain-containing protein [Ustulina deusta]